MKKKDGKGGSSGEYEGLKGGPKLEHIRGTIQTPFKDRVVSGRGTGKK
jgi:hypothetical protein